MRVVLNFIYQIFTDIGRTNMSAQLYIKYNFSKYSENITHIKIFSGFTTLFSFLLLIGNLYFTEGQYNKYYKLYPIIYLALMFINGGALYFTASKRFLVATFIGELLHHLYALFFLLLLTSLTILDIGFAGQLTAYTIGVIFISLIFRTRLRWFFLISLVSLLFLLTGIYLLNPSPLLFMNYAVNSVAIFFLGLLIFYINEKNRRSNFVTKNFIEHQHRDLKELVKKDSLTGLYNRRHLNEVLPVECERARRYGRRVAMMVIDIDHFKKINDTYGHLKGDLILTQVAAIIKESIRQTDTATRYGGEEFVALLIEIEESAAYKCAERIRTRCESTAFAGVTWPVTVTIGLSIYEGEDPELFFSNTDKLLYYGKENGRNRVVRKKDVNHF